MNIVEFLIELFSNIGRFSKSKTEESANFSNRRIIGILQAITFFTGTLLLYFESSYIWGLKEPMKSILVFLSISILMSLILILILHKFEVLYSLNFPQFLWLTLSFSVFLLGIFYGINFLLSDLFFASKT